MRLLQIIPRRPPPEAALVHVAALLTSELEARGVRCETAHWFDGRGGVRERLPGTGADEAVLLHYVGYGYARRGAPLRLLREIEAWKRRTPGARLLVQFHEIAASGPPWRSSFWTGPLQVTIARRLARLAAGAVTSLERFAQRLRRFAPALPVEVLPVFSNVGEPESVAPLHTRDPSVVLFAGPSGRAYVWRHLVDQLEAVVHATGARRVLEIGAQPEGPPVVGSVPVERRGELCAAAVSSELSRARTGFLAYHPPYLGKSTAYAAFSAHGMLPVCDWVGGEPGPAIGEGERWCRSARLPELDAERRQGLASAARQWYRDHPVRRHAESWLRWLR
jgi:hypothetical protein